MKHMFEIANKSIKKYCISRTMNMENLKDADIV